MSHWTSRLPHTCHKDRRTAGDQSARCAATGPPGDGRSRIRPRRQDSFTVEQRWRVDDLIGFVYATSFLPASVVAAHAAAFQADLADWGVPRRHRPVAPRRSPGQALSAAERRGRGLTLGVRASMVPSSARQRWSL